MAESRHIHNVLGEILKYPMEQLPIARCYRSGDLIAFKRMSHWHFAIVIEVVDGIIHFIEYQSDCPIDDILTRIKCGSPSAEGKVVVTSKLKDFNKSKLWYVCVPDSDCLREEEVVQRAKSKLGEESYDVIFNNCEHFALWCKTGESYSSQVDTATKFAVQHGTRVVAKGVAGAMATYAIKKAAEETMKPVAEAVVKSTTKEVVKIAAKSTTKEAVKVAAKSTTKEAVKIATKSTTKEIVITAAKSTTKEVVITVAKSTTKEVVTKEAVKTGAKSTTRQVATAMIAGDVAVGVGFALWDIANANEKYESGEITKDEFKCAVGTRAAVAVGDMSLGTAGMMVGTAMLGPVGGVVGGIIGSVYGTIIGATAANIIRSNN